MAETAVGASQIATSEPAAERWWNAPPPERTLWKDVLHIFAIFNFAVAYPMLEMTGQADCFFVVENADWLDVAMVAFIISLLVPAILASIIALTHALSSRVRGAVHALMIVAILILGSFLTVINAANFDTALRWGPVLFFAAMTLTFLYLRLEAVQSLATILALSVVIVPGYFLTSTDVSRYAFAGEAPEVGEVLVGSPTHVILVVYDELPLVSILDEDLEIDADRYPNFARLAADSHWFFNATTVQEATRHSLPAILSGTFPDVNAPPTSTAYPHNLFSMLANTHEALVSEPATRLCVEPVCERPDPDVRDRASLWLRSTFVPDSPPITTARSRYRLDERSNLQISPSEGPQLLFHHSLLPHFPWIHLPDGTQYEQTEHGTIGLEQRVGWGSDDWLVTQAYQRHLLQVEYIDQLLGDLIERAEAAGIYDEALVIVTADHGISFQSDARYRRFESETSASILPVPFFVKLPGQTEGVRSERNVQTIDILPTVADVLGVEHDWTFDGVSVFDDSDSAPEHKTVVGSSGEHLELPSPIEGIETLVREKIALFGTGAEPDALFRVGEYDFLVGVEVADLEDDSTIDVRVSFDGSDRYLDVDLSRSLIPAFIQGTVNTGEDSIESETRLAVSVNGTIRAVTRTYLDDGDIRFGAMVPRESFVDGPNSVQVFLVSGPDSEPVIREISRTVR
jgi:hypothetical protein